MPASAAHILDFLADRVLLCDGGMGSEAEAHGLDLDRDLRGHAHFADILCLTRPDLVRDIHLAHLRAGADAVETNSFSASPVTLDGIGFGGSAHELNRRAAELAHEAVALCAPAGRPRFVIGAVGPGGMLPSRGEIDGETLEAGYAAQCRGLVAGGVDAILIETCRDVLQIEAAIAGARRAGAEVPVFVQVSTEPGGGLLRGDLAAVAALARARRVPLLGLNCAAGPATMAAPLRWLAENWEGLLSAQPSAGLPELAGSRARYPTGPAEFAAWQERFVCEFGVNLVGGCCGTEASHIAAVDAVLRRLAPDGFRPRRFQPARPPTAQR